MERGKKFEVKIIQVLVKQTDKQKKLEAVLKSQVLFLNSLLLWDPARKVIVLKG